MNPEYLIGHPILNALTNEPIRGVFGGSKEEEKLFRVMNGGNKLFFSNPDEYELWQQEQIERGNRKEVIPVSTEIRENWLFKKII